MDNLVSRICEFYNSPENVLIVEGPDGCGKSTAILNSLELSGENFLTFYHSCFEFCTIDDFLLNFYDSFKKYSTSRNITFKKVISDEFSNKIVNYFRETDCNFVIFVDNFELVRNKKEISDFLFRIADFKNVKLILATSEKLDTAGKNAVIIEVAASQKDDIKRFLAISDEYQNLLKTFAMLYHPTSLEFLEKYKFAGGAQVEYLLKIEALKNASDGEFCLRKHLRHYFLNKLDKQEKSVLAQKLIGVYENELSKSPKDRLLRLSRESLRNLVAHFSPRLPASRSGVPNFSYLAQTYINTVDWNKIPEGSEAAPPARQEKSEDKKLNPSELIEHAEACESVYNYSGAIDLLNQARFLSGVNSEGGAALEVKILSKLSRNYIKTNAHEQAISCEIKIFDLLKAENEPKAQHSLYRIGLIYKNLFDWENAVKYFEKVLTKQSVTAPLTLSKTFLNYGEIEEGRDANNNNALEKYKKAFEISRHGNDPKLLAVSCECCYKIAQIYDLRGEIDFAREFYRTNIEIKDVAINAFLGASYLALADTLSGNEALDYYKAAIDIFKAGKNGGNLEELYFIYDKLAQNTKYTDTAAHFNYLNDAKKAALKLKDNFKLAFIFCEIGDYYYAKNLDRDAVFNYLEARKAIGSGASEENLKKINSRLDDMKIKMGISAYDAALREFKA